MRRRRERRRCHELPRACRKPGRPTTLPPYRCQGKLQLRCCPCGASLLELPFAAVRAAVFTVFASKIDDQHNVWKPFQHSSMVD